MILLLTLYSIAAGYCGWCLCIAAHRPAPPPPKCDDTAFEPVLNH